jgi:hypothetical protein
MSVESDEERGLPEAEFADLLQSVTAMAPLLRGVLGAAKPVGPTASPREDASENDRGNGAYCKRREALLIALKPYLSPARCRAVDYLIRLSRVGDAIRNLQ